MTDNLLYTAAIPFEAAREVDILPVGHRSRRLHGHSFLAKVRATVPVGWGGFIGAEVGTLRDKLTSVVAPLDYQSLNKAIDQPTDENIARWIRARVDAPGVESVGVQSTAHEGVDLDADGNAHVWRRYVLQSAHWLPNVPIGHKCGRLHGHGFEVILHAKVLLGSAALGIDYDRLDEIWEPIHRDLDHMCLNDVPGLQIPTSELIAEWLWNRVRPVLPTLAWVTVYETGQCGANFDGENFRIWKELTLDSAIALKNAPEGDVRRRVHGHTYVLRLHLQAPIDRVLGWTIDFGDVKSVFDPVFREIDHRPLHELRDLDQPDVAGLARWIRDHSIGQLPCLSRVDLYETRGCGVILSEHKSEVVLPI